MTINRYYTDRMSVDSLTGTTSNNNLELAYINVNSSGNITAPKIISSNVSTSNITFSDGSSQTQAGASQGLAVAMSIIYGGGY